MTRHGCLWLFFFTLLFNLPARAGEIPASGPLPDFDIELAASLIDQEHALLLDVRTREEFDQDHIQGAIFIPFQEFSQYLEEIARLTGGDKHRPIVLYCRTGRRAGLVKKVLLQEGYTMVTNLGGLKDWRRKYGG